ncbi:unnamed protein product, partial [Rotaria sordida]
MHGLGNDFVIINKKDLPKNCNLQQLSLNISNRNTGIGCDQFIIYNKQLNYYEMLIYNQDGSSAKLCGDDIKLPDNIFPSNQVSAILEKEVIILAVPSYAFDNSLNILKEAQISPNIVLLVATKGFSKNPTELLSDR